ncbi:MAG TPA: hypothetical protein VF792_10835 [Ktedonobacterales bacterium]
MRGHHAGRVRLDLKQAHIAPSDERSPSALVYTGQTILRGDDSEDVTPLKPTHAQQEPARHTHTAT